jgi:ribosome production factor 2
MMLDVAHFFRGTVIDSINLAGIEHVIVCTAADDTIFFRHYGISLKKSGSKIPRVELVESGPAFDCVIRRHKFASDDLLREALKVPKQLKVAKKKNLETTALGETMATIHMGRQDLTGLTTRRVKALKRKYQHITADSAAAAADTQQQQQQQQDVEPRRKRARSSDSSAAADN